MAKAILAFILSIIIGWGFSFISADHGVVASISTIGAFIIYQNEEKKE